MSVATNQEPGHGLPEQQLPAASNEKTSDESTLPAETATDPTVTSTVSDDSAIVVEKADVPKKPLTQEDEYKAKLAENRRLAREKAEREAAEQKQQEEERK